MILNLSDLSDEPLQGQIVRQVRAKILAGELAADCDLPSIRSLAREQRVSVITVQRAYESLVREGLIHSRRGKGFFVSGLDEAMKKSMAIRRLNEKIESLVSAALAEGLSKQEIESVVTEILREESGDDKSI